MVNVLLTVRLDNENLQRITSFSPELKIVDASGLFRAERDDPDAKEKLNVLLVETEVIYGRRLPQNVIARAPKLKWVQVMSAGVNMFLDREMVASPVKLTGVSGIHAVPISEFVVQHMLMFAKGALICAQLKQEKRWRQFNSSVLKGKTVGIVGLGHIGREVARLCQAFGMKVIANHRSSKENERARYIDIMLPANRLKELLAECDFIVLALPLTPDTEKIIGEEELRSMKPTAYLINIARGGIVDEKALIRALKEKWIAGAGLDVFATEPLPPDSPLWEMPNVIFSPHIAGSMEGYDTQATDIFCENLKRYLEGKRLINLINKKWGY